MTAKGARKYPEDRLTPLKVTPLNWDEIEAWHAKARHLRDTTDMTIRQIAAEVGRTFGPVQRFLNPESRRKMKDRQKELEQQRRRTDPQYATKVRTYVRKYMQLRAEP